MKCLCVCVFKLEKVYNSENEEDDMVQMEEERLRMREHVMNEVSCHSNRADVWGYVQSCCMPDKHLTQIQIPV